MYISFTSFYIAKRVKETQTGHCPHNMKGQDVPYCPRAGDTFGVRILGTWKSEKIQFKC